SDHAECHAEVSRDGHLGRLRRNGPRVRGLWRACHRGVGNRAGDQTRHRADAGRQARVAGVHDGAGNPYFATLKKGKTNVQRMARGSTLAIAAAALSAHVALAAADAPSGKAIKPAPAFTKQQLTALPQDAWITNGGNIFNQRYSPLTEINRDTVKN